MRNVPLGVSGLQVPAVGVGCMRLAQLSIQEADALFCLAMESGANFFDHADIYGDGACERLFGQILSMHPNMRDKLTIQTKCGIIPGVSYDLSKAHIIRSVTDSLRRLGTDYLDVLLLHRPDALMEPEEVAAVFDELHEKGLVRWFGVSNEKSMQIRLLQKHLRQPLVANQLQLSLANAGIISNGLHVNTPDNAAIDRDGSILDFCRLQDITIQTWSPFQYGMFQGSFLGSSQYPELNAEIDALAASYCVSNTTIALAWLLRHPANMQTIVGTTNLDRLRACFQAADLRLHREEWYALYLAAGNTLP